MVTFRGRFEVPTQLIEDSTVNLKLSAPIRHKQSTALALGDRNSKLAIALRRSAETTCEEAEESQRAWFLN